MNYNSKRLLNPLKPICKCKTVEFNMLVDVIRGSTATKDHNKNFAFRKTMEALTSPCVDKDTLTLAEIVKVIPYPIANEEVSIECDVFDENNEVKPNGFFILVGEDNSIKLIESIYYDAEKSPTYQRNSNGYDDQRIKNIRFPLTDKDIILIKEVLIFGGILGTEHIGSPDITSSYTGTIYMYKLN